jgi:glycosyltransferase involved in cell wall biosynthesis
LLDALTSLPQQDWRLTVIGGSELDPPYARAIRHRIAALGLAGKIDLLGRRSQEELAERLRESHLLVVPSSYEGFGIVYLEAMRFGLPVIAGDAGGPREIVSHGVNGFLVPPSDPAALTRYLEAFIKNRSLLRQMSLAALTSSASQPTWEASAQRVRDFLLEFS